MSHSTAELPNAPRNNPTDNTRDLASEIERSVPREPRDKVRCAHLFDSFYRCNWWAPSRNTKGDRLCFDWATAATHVVRKSTFLRANVDAGVLTITEIDTTAHP